MKTTKLLLLTGLLCPGILLSAGTIVISNEGTTFTPNEVTINPGDTVVFEIASTHNVVEVNNTTWDAGGNTSNGGFTLPFGGGQLVFNEPGTYYYVCEPHASIGMKGIINVETATYIAEQEENSESPFSFYPNPVSGEISINFQIRESSPVSIELIDISGKKLTTLINGTYSAGTFTETLMLDNLNAGNYFLRFVSDYESIVEPLIILE